MDRPGVSELFFQPFLNNQVEAGIGDHRDHSPTLETMAIFLLLLKCHAFYSKHHDKASVHYLRIRREIYILYTALEMAIEILTPRHRPGRVNMTSAPRHIPSAWREGEGAGTQSPTSLPTEHPEQPP